MGFSYIIAYRHSPDRILNLKRVIEWVKSLGDVELIIVEQDDSPKLPDEIPIDFKYRFAQNPLPFCKSWSLNIGRKLATQAIVVFGDSDVIMDKDEFLDAMQYLEEFEAVSPYNRVIDLTSAESVLPVVELSKIERDYRGEKDVQKTPIAGGIIAFRDKAIDRIGGWCEEFIGWGGEDDYQSTKIRMFLRWKELGNRSYHLFHTREKPLADYYGRNVTILNKLNSLSPAQTLAQINATKDRLADEKLFIRLAQRIGAKT